MSSEMNAHAEHQAQHEQSGDDREREARTPSSARALLAALPDAPCWVETRALLLSGRAIVRGSLREGSALVLDPDGRSGFLVGRADATLLRDAAAVARAGFELVVQTDAAGEARAALPRWHAASAIVHSPARPWPASGGDLPPAVVVDAPPQEHWLARVPQDDEIRFYAALAEAIALCLADEEVVAVCAAGDVTETLWDVGIDTLASHRRRGYAAAAFRALAGHMAAAGKQPVWCAEEGNAASLGLAARLGFVAVDRIAILTAPGPPTASTQG